VKQLLCPINNYLTFNELNYVKRLSGPKPDLPWPIIYLSGTSTGRGLKIMEAGEAFSPYA
jgi:hypothetical protein